MSHEVKGKEQMPLVEFIEDVLMVELSVWQKAQIVKHMAIPKDRFVRKERMNVTQTKEEST